MASKHGRERERERGGGGGEGWGDGAASHNSAFTVNTSNEPSLLESPGAAVRQK
jgi:hypothetical protein